MRIVFTVLGNSRRSNYLNGDTIRYGGGGGSGTDTSTIIVAEQLALQGHEVVICTERLEPQLEAKGFRFEPAKKVRGVTYTDFNFSGIENREFDVLINSLWFHKYSELPIKVTKALVYWSHMQWIYGVGEMVEYARKNNLRLAFVHISEWEKSMTTGVVNWAIEAYNNTVSTTIPNPVMDDIIEEVLRTNPVRKRHKFVFHAAWARGGNVAVEAVRHLNYPDSEFHAFDYLMCTHHHTDKFFNMHNGVDKKTLFTHIAESEYFIYPLYTPYKDVHKDTFSCVVAEAIALGAIPVTYPLGALPENFGPYCAWMDFPRGADPEKMQKEPLSKDEVGIFNTVSPIVEKILQLEKDQDLKNRLVFGGKEHILSNFGSSKIGVRWRDFLTKL